MFNGKFVMALVTIVMTVFAICRLGNPKGLKENFGAGSGMMMTQLQISDCNSGWKTSPAAIQQAALTAPSRAVSQKLNMDTAAARGALYNAQNNALKDMQISAAPTALTRAVHPGSNLADPQVRAGIANTVSASVAESAVKFNNLGPQSAAESVSGVQDLQRVSVAPPTLKEGFVNPNGPTSGGCGFKQSDFYQVPGFIQKAPPPRGGASVGYGPNITYNPPRQHMATSYDYADMVKENYQPRQGCNDKMRNTAMGTASHPNGGRVLLGGDYMSNKEGYDAAREVGNLATDQENRILDSSIPVNGMENVSPDGEIVPAIVCNLMTAINRPSHRIGMGDPIRGDLPIPPPCGNWFTSSWGTSGLQQGALHVLGGENAIDNEMLALKNLYHPDGTNGTTTIGGYTVDNNKAISTTTGIFGGAAAATAMSANVPLSVAL